MIGLFNFMKRKQPVDPRSHTERTRDHYTGMEIRLQRRISNLREVIYNATNDLNESEAILRSVLAAQHSLDVHITDVLIDNELDVALALADLNVDKTDPSMPMGENGNSRID